MGVASIKGESILWLGEKTGRHSKFTGTTIATKINNNNYIISVAIVKAVSSENIGKILTLIIEYISSQNNQSF